MLPNPPKTTPELAAIWFDCFLKVNGPEHTMLTTEAELKFQARRVELRAFCRQKGVVPPKNFMAASFAIAVVTAWRAWLSQGIGDGAAYFCEFHKSPADQRTLCRYAIRHGFDKLEGFAKYQEHCTIRQVGK